jgi:PAS domain-containing protein
MGRQASVEVKRISRTFVSRQNQDGDSVVTKGRQSESEARDREEFFHSLLDESSDLVTVLESDAMVRYVNASSERLLGYKLTILPISWRCLRRGSGILER